MTQIHSRKTDNQPFSPKELRLTPSTHRTTDLWTRETQKLDNFFMLQGAYSPPPPSGFSHMNSECRLCLRFLQNRNMNLPVDGTFPEKKQEQTRFQFQVECRPFGLYLIEEKRTFLSRTQAITIQGILFEEDKLRSSYLFEEGMG